MNMPTADELDRQAGELIRWVEINVIKGKEFDDLDYDGLAQMAAMELGIPVSAQVIGETLNIIAHQKNLDGEFS